MLRIAYRAGDDTTVVDAVVGASVMQTAVRNGIDGILAECGGNALCATCHVYVEEGPVDALPPVSAVEDDMLDSTASPREANSRLSCQLPVTSELDGLVVRVACRQV